MLLVRVLGAPWFGHGRMMEATLAIICGVYGLLLFLIPGAAQDSQATRDLFWEGYGNLVGLPFLLKAVLTGYGLLSNIKAWPYSRELRFYGGLVGSFIWGWLIFKFANFGSPFTFGSVCAGVFLISSIRIIGMALADLPKPGTPGAGVT